METAPAFSNVAEAAQMQLNDEVKKLLDEGSPIDARDADGCTALHWATFHDDEEWVKQLLEAGANQEVPNYRGDLAAHWAAKDSRIKILRLLMENNPETVLFGHDADGFTVFLLSAQQNAAPILEWLYIHGTCVEDRDDQGRTPLMWASYKGHRRTVQWLLSRSANVASHDDEGMTALHWAACRGHTAITRMLLEVGAAPFVLAEDASGDHSLKLSIKERHFRVAFLLVKCMFCMRLFGRPSLTNTYLASVFMLLSFFNAIVYCILVWRACAVTPVFTATWPVTLGLTVAMWFRAAGSDPGWTHSQVILHQGKAINKLSEAGLLNIWRVSLVEQMAKILEIQGTIRNLADQTGVQGPDPLSPTCSETSPGSNNFLLGAGSTGTVASSRPRCQQPQAARACFSQRSRLEALQPLVALQQQLVSHVCRSLEGGSSIRTHSTARRWELQPLMQGADSSVESRPGSGAYALLSSPAGRSGQFTRESTEGSKFFCEERADRQIQQVAKCLPTIARLTALSLGCERRSSLMRSTSDTEYLESVEEFDFEKTCIICHARRGFRAFHCKDCGRCVGRLDHHCPWIDNCVGIGNQRLFYIFLVVLLIALSNAMIVSFMLLQAHLPVWKSRSPAATGSFWKPSKGVNKDNDDLWLCMLEVGTILVNGAWFCFVSALLFRQTAFIVANLTTYEVLLTPGYVQRRFPNHNKTFWYFADCGFVHSLRRCFGFWTCNNSWDTNDFCLGNEADCSKKVDCGTRCPSPPHGLEPKCYFSQTSLTSDLGYIQYVPSPDSTGVPVLSKHAEVSTTSRSQSRELRARNANANLNGNIVVAQDDDIISASSGAAV